MGKFSNILKTQFWSREYRPSHCIVLYCFGSYPILVALCQYVTAAGFPPRPSQLFFNNGRVDRNSSIKNENDMEYVLWNLIKGSIELTHGSACNGVWKLQSMNVSKLLSTNFKADWNIKCPFRIIAYIYSNQDILIFCSNLLDISISCFIKILSYGERLDVNS